MLESGDDAVDHAAVAQWHAVDGELPDVRCHPIASLLRGEDSALANIVRRVVEQAGQSVYAAHGSTPTPL